MANGIGRVWAANAGDDEQRPNGVGSVWIENIDALAPSGGASEQQINDLSAAIDYVSANAGDPNALTGYQEAGGEISSTSSFFVAKGGDYVITANPGNFNVSGAVYDFHVGEGGHLTANNSCSAVFTNGSTIINTNNALISADGSYGFYTSGNTNTPAILSVETKGIYTSANGASISANGSRIVANTYGSTVSSDSNGFVTSSNYGSLLSATAPGFVASGNNYHISATAYGLQTKNRNHNIKADIYGIDISSYDDNPLKYRTRNRNITLGSDSNGFAFNVSSNQYSACIDSYGIYDFSGSNYIGSFGRWNGDNASAPISYNIVGVGFSGAGTDFGVYNAGKLKVRNMGEIVVTNGGHLSATNSCSALFNNGSRTEITNSHVLLVGNNDIGSMNGVVVSGTGIEFIKIYNGGSVKVVDGNEVNLSGVTNKIGNNLNASGSRFVSADGEGVSAWQKAPMTVMGAYNQTSSNAAFVIGNGSGTNASARSDLFVIDYSGNAKSNDFIAVPPEQETLLVASSTQLRTDPTLVASDIINSADVGSDSLDTTFKMDVSFVDDISFGTGQSIGITVNPLGYFNANSKDDFKALSSFKITELSSKPGWSFTRSNDVDSWSGMKWRLFRAVTISPDPYNVGVSAYQKEQPVPVSVTALNNSFTELYNAFIAYTASHP